MRLFWQIIILSIVGMTSCNNMSEAQGQKKANKLINESSPYLLQHAYNPVDWHPWGEEALKKAKDENKLLLVSVGYAACHWCHVMEHESFEDSTVAALMNEHFVSVKVDREERPDVDDIYMSAAQLVTGSGGWPLNAFALPDGRPIYAGTYYPKDQWMDMLNQFADLKNSDYDRLVRSADQLVSGISSLDDVIVTEVKEHRTEDVQTIAKTFLKQIDFKEGGRKGAPKFPMPNNYDYLLKYATLYDDASAMEAVGVTLDKMARGGIYDQAGGGFARYSVDDIWLVPHFEKMLYDNAQLISLYSDAYRLKNIPLYKHTIEQSLEFVQRELMDDQGRFYSSLDADSEGEEGKFYVWGAEDLDRIFPDALTRTVISDYYNFSSGGNWEHGNNILHITRTKLETAEKHNITLEQLDEMIASANASFLNERKSRVRPGLDDKILTSWNALMIKGLIDAYKALGTKEYLDLAIKGAHSLMNDQMQEDFRLLRNYKDGKASINAFLDDYALTIQAFLSLYEVTFDESWIHISKDLTDYTIAHFFNEDSKMFYFTSDIDPPLVARKTELNDNVIPGSNSTMARNLYKLGELLYNEEYSKMSHQMLSNMWESIESNGQPAYYSNWLQLHFDMVHPPYEIAVTGKDAIATAHEMMKTYRPNVVYLGDTKDSELPLLKYKYVDDQTMIYVCQNKTCKLPVTEITKAEELLK